MRLMIAGMATVLLGACSATGQDTYDLVILNGRVMDPETEFDAVRNVGIEGGRIVTITEEEISGADSLDATGHVVTAGFIDTHTHSSDKFSIRMSMRDGVTSGMDLELGALNISAWYEREAGQWEMNYGTAVSHEMTRMVVHDKLELSDPIDASDIFNLRAESVKDDMQQAVPMDRLVCGDVGFGKTEVAVRAAFKAVQDRKQVAVLVPTTVLAAQHERTFRRRLGAFPVRIAQLSRFRTAAELKESLDKLATGEIDIAIGTHRLQFLALDAKRRIALFTFIADLGTQHAQSVDKDAYRAFLHALRTRQHDFAIVAGSDFIC